MEAQAPQLSETETSIISSLSGMLGRKSISIGSSTGGSRLPSLALPFSSARASPLCLLGVQYPIPSRNFRARHVRFYCRKRGRIEHLHCQ